MSATNKLTNPAVSKSGEVDTLLIEKFNGKVKEAFVREENIRRFFHTETVVGTNTVTEKFAGETELQVMTPGQSVEATKTDYDKNSLVVDTAVIARNAEAIFHNIQSDIVGNHSKLAKNQSKQLARLEDEMLIQQAIYGAQSNTKALRGAARVSGHGFSQQVSISEDQAEDPEALQAAIELALENMLTGVDGGDGIDLSDVYVMLPWKEFNILRDAERIVNGNYNTYEGDTVTGFTLKSYNVPIIPSNRFPSLVPDGSGGHVVKTKTGLLATNNSNQRYKANEDQAKTKALIFTGNALLVGVTIEMTSDIFYDKHSKSWIIDTFQSEGAIPSSWECVGVVDVVGDTENKDVTKRAARKILRVRDVT